MGVTLEGLLTHPDAFGLTTATPLQRAVCRVADGLPLGELRHNPDVQWAFGGIAALGSLPVGQMPFEVYFVAAVRGAKTLFSSALAFRSAITCDCSHLRRGEIPRASIVSLDLDKAKVAVEHLSDSLASAKLLRRFFVRAKGDTVVIRHPSGRLVQIKCVAGKKAGGSLVSRWSAGAIFDEAPRMQGQEEGVVNFEEQRKAVKARMLAGAQIVALGSPWAPRGPIYNAVQDKWGKPSRALVVVRGRGPMLNPYWWTPEKIEEVRNGEDGELILQTDCEAEFGDVASQFFTSKDIKAATPEGRTMSLPYDPEWSYAAFQDPATRSNAWTLVIVGKKTGATEAESEYAVVKHYEWKGTRAKPLKAKAVFKEMKPMLAEYGLSSVTTDKWSADTIAEIAAGKDDDDEDIGIEVLIDEATDAEKAKRYLDARELIVADPPRMSLPPCAQFRGDMLAIKKELLTGGGIRFKLPVTNDGRHADYAPSFVGAAALAKAGPSWMDAMSKLAARNAKPRSA